eukprot:3896853-Pleurochrysis_carterae.AAC.1
MLKKTHPYPCREGSTSIVGCVCLRNGRARRMHVRKDARCADGKVGSANDLEGAARERPQQTEGKTCRVPACGVCVPRVRDARACRVCV